MKLMYLIKIILVNIFDFNNLLQWHTVQIRSECIESTVFKLITSTWSGIYIQHCHYGLDGSLAFHNNWM